MADALTPTRLGAWSGEDTDIGEVLEALERLRREGERTATRTSVLSLVALATDAEEADRACQAMRALGGRHPGRTIVLVCQRHGTEGGESRIDGLVTLHAQSAGGVTTWSEDVVLTVTGPLTQHLDSLIEPLTLPDLPLACWYVASRPEADDGLAAAADVVIVDGKELGEEAVFPELLQLARGRRSVLDLSWVRLRPWRILLANLFEGRDYRPFAAGVHSGVVEGKPGPRHLLGGWLCARLDLEAGAVELVDSRHAGMRLSARVGGRTARFSARRDEGERMVRAMAEVDGGPSHHDLLPLAPRSLEWSLAEALGIVEGDPVYEDALEAALRFRW